MQSHPLRRITEAASAECVGIEAGEIWLTALWLEILPSIVGA